jgi:hypothetical protein
MGETSKNVSQPPIGSCNFLKDLIIYLTSTVFLKGWKLPLFVSRFSFMAESSSRPRLTKIVLGIGGLFSAIVIVCFSVGGSLYIQERSKAQSYVKDSCRVRSASYETIDRCLQEGTKTTRYKTCYVAVWHVEFGQNGTRREIIRSNSEYSYKYVEAKSEQYKVCSTSS